MIERTVLHDFPGSRRIYGIIHIELRVVDRIRHAERICGKRQVVIPRKDAEDAVLFIKEVIVSGLSEIAVQIDDENLYGKVAEDLVYIYSGVQVGIVGI